MNWRWVRMLLLVAAGAFLCAAWLPKKLTIPCSSNCVAGTECQSAATCLTAYCNASGVCVEKELGSGTDGAITVSSNRNLNTDTLISGRSFPDAPAFVVSGTVLAGATSVTLSTAPTGLSVGDEVVIINMGGTSSSYSNVGNFETRILTEISANTLSFAAALTKDYGTSGTHKIVVQRVPHYTNVTINAGVTLTADAWNGSKGGLLMFRATGTVTVSGNISVSSKGYRGGNGVTPGNYSVNASGGETYNGVGGNGGIYNQNGLSGQGGGGGGGVKNSVTYYFNGGAGTVGGAGGGGGSALCGCEVVGAGGGGGYGTVGTGGNSVPGASGSGSTGGAGGGPTASSPDHWCCYGGSGGGGGTYGTAELSTLFLGSGGGNSAGGQGYNGSGRTGPGQAGGSGGGIIAIWANAITVTGTISANGANGSLANVNTFTSPGGGGAGGSVRLQAPTMALGTSKVTATGGAQVCSTNAGAQCSGAGGVGRIAIYAGAVTGATSPAASQRDLGQ